MRKLEHITKEVIQEIKENNLYVSLKTGEVRSEPFKERKAYDENLLKDVHTLYLEGYFYTYDLYQNFNLPYNECIIRLFKKRGWKTLNLKETYEVYGEQITASRRKTNTLKFGVDNPMKSKEITKNRVSPFSRPEVQAKGRETLKERCGFDNAMKCEKYKKKQEATMLRKHKVRHNWCKGPLRDGQIQTMQDRYQCSYTFESPELMEKVRETNKEFWDTETPQSTIEVKRKAFRAKGIEWMLDAELIIRDKLQTGLVSDDEIIREIYETFPYHKSLSLLKDLNLKSPRSFSQETKLRLWLEEQNVNHLHNIYTGSGLFSETGRPRQLDFKLLDYPVAIEVNGLYNHSADGRCKDFEENFHLEKFMGCFYNKTTLLSFTDYEIDSCFDFVISVISFHLGLVEQSKVLEEFEKIKDSIDLTTDEFTRSCNYGMYKTIKEIEESDIEKIEIRPRHVNGYTYFDSGLLNLGE